MTDRQLRLEPPKNVTLPQMCQCDWPAQNPCPMPPTQEDLFCDECRYGCQEDKRQEQKRQEYEQHAQRVSA